MIDVVRALAGRPGMRRFLQFAQGAVLLAVVILLLIQLSEIGWRELFTALPANPWFYLIFVLRYFLQPLSEIPAYQLVWRTSLWRHWSAFLRKKAYNFAVMGYSGEAFFTVWARRTLTISDRDIVVGVKDNNLVSAMVSNASTAAIVAALFLFTDFRVTIGAIPGGQVVFALAFLSAAVLSVAVTVFRRQFIQLPKGMTRKIVAINAARIALVLILHAMLYAAAIPTAPLGAWLVFIALQLALSRIPFLPNQDIVFLTAALSLASEIDAPQAAIAGMLFAEAGLSQILNLALFAATAHHAVRRGEVANNSPVEADNPELPAP